MLDFLRLVACWKCCVHFLNCFLVFEYKAKCFYVGLCKKWVVVAGLVGFCVYDHSIWSFVL